MISAEANKLYARSNALPPQLAHPTGHATQTVSVSSIIALGTQTAVRIYAQRTMVCTILTIPLIAIHVVVVRTPHAVILIHVSQSTTPYSRVYATLTATVPTPHQSVKKA